MALYETRKVTIEAVEFTYPITDELKDFVGDSLGTVSKQRHLGSLAEAEICTLEDGEFLKVKHIATEGDYIIKGLQGEFYACKPDIFHMKYILFDKDAAI
jgi:hypothetical protein